MRQKSIQDIQREISRGVSDLESASKEAYQKNKERIGNMESDIDSLRSQVESLYRTVEVMASALESTREQLSDANDKIENLLNWAAEAEMWRDVFEDWAAQLQKEADGPGYKSPPRNDAYSDLGLSPGASKEEIRRAYRDLAKKHHPDKGGDAKVFQKIQKAYDDLMEAA